MTIPAHPTRQQTRSRRTREHIAGAALVVFASKGYAEASMDDVCQAAGCSKGGLYHHFPSKLAVLEAVIDRLRVLGSLHPPFGPAALDTGLPETSVARLLVDVWAEAARSPRLQASLNGSTVGQDTMDYLGSVLLIGSMVQSLTQQPDALPEGAVARLGIQRAA